MKEAKIAEVKNHLSRYLALVRKGEVVRILDRNIPVAQIVPINDATGGRVGAHVTGVMAGVRRSCGAAIFPL
jgi:prevent-host-death family protein